MDMAAFVFQKIAECAQHPKMRRNILYKIEKFWQEQTYF